MRKLSVLLVLVIFGAGLLFASGSGEEESSAEAEEMEMQEGVSLDIISHRVHKLITEKGAGGDILSAWIEENDAISEINWTPLEIKPLHDRLFREASASSTNVDVSYILNTNATPRTATLLEPLDEYLEKNPIPNFEEDFPQGMLDAVTFDGKLYGIPIRAATHGLAWNEQLFNMRGLDGPPKTPEQFEEYARRLTFKRDDGTQVYGYAAHSHFYYTGVNSMARMWDGGFIDSDLEVVADQEATIKAVAMLRRFYEDGIMPQQVTSWAHAEKQRAMQLGQVAMSFDVMGKITGYNDPEETDWDSWRVAAYPIAPELQDKYPVGPANTEFWLMVIPKNAEHKDASWEYIRYLSTHEAALAMALNGNGPARLSVFGDPKFQEEVPYADILQQAQKVARVPLPAFDKSPQAADMIDLYIERAMLGDMSPENAMQELAVELRNLSDQLQ